MKASLLEKVMCPVCKGCLDAAGGELRCPSCGVAYPEVDGMPNFLPPALLERYARELKMQDLAEERAFYEKMYAQLNGIDDGHCVVYGYEEIYRFMSDVPRSAVLDVGCGAGHHSKDLSQLGYAVTGIDISPNGLRQARAVARGAGQEIDFVIGDIENMPFKDGAFETTFCSLILHHFPNREKILREIGRVTRRHFVTFEVNAYDPISFLRFNVINPTIGIKNITKNQRTVSPTRLERELRALGFEGVQTRFVDVHHNVGRYPDSAAARALAVFRKLARVLPYRCRHNKFIMKAARAGGTPA